MYLPKLIKHTSQCLTCVLQENYSLLFYMYSEIPGGEDLYFLNMTSCTSRCCCAAEILITPIVFKFLHVYCVLGKPKSCICDNYPIELFVKLFILILFKYVYCPNNTGYTAQRRSICTSFHPFYLFGRSCGSL
jgi:hypothetical protein